MVLGSVACELTSTLGEVVAEMVFQTREHGSCVMRTLVCSHIGSESGFRNLSLIGLARGLTLTYLEENFEHGKS